MKTFTAHLFALVILSSLNPASFAQEALLTSASTTADAKIPVTTLRILVRPLMKGELETERNGWLEIVKAKAEEIRDLEIQLINRDGDAAGINLQLIELKSQRAELIERANVVVKALAARGGEANEAEKYLKQVQSINAPTTDVKAAMNTAKAWATSKEGGMKWLKNLGMFAFTLFVFRILSRIASKLVSKSVKRFPQASSLLHQFLTNFSRGVVMVIGVVMALAYLDVNIGPLLAAMGAAGFILAFALQGTLSNFAAGIMILLYKPYDLGDAISAAGVTGKVDSKNLVSTTLLTPDNQSVIVPNSSIWGDVITNITANPTRRVDLTIGIGYGDDIDQARQALLSVMSAHNKVLSDPQPVVEVNQLADSSVNLIVRPWCLTGDYWQVYWDLTRLIKERLDTEGISIPFPQTDIHIHQVNPT